MLRRSYLGLILLIGLFSCQKEKFVYESEWLTPLFHSELGIQDLIADSLLDIGTDNSLELVVEYEEALDSLLEILEVPDSLSEVSISLTQLLLDDRSFVDTITLAEIYPPAILLNGQTTNLDAQDISSSDATVIDVTEEFFKTATFQEGFLDMAIYNDLPVDIELIEFELANQSDGSIVIDDSFTDIAPGSSANKTYNLAGMTVDGILEAKLKRVRTKASSGPVLIEAYKGIRLELNVRDLKPESATAVFPAQDLIQQEEETTYNFGGPQITTMRLKEGEVLMEVYSTIEEEIILEYRVPQSAHIETGDPIYKEFRITPAENGQPSRTDERFPIGNFEIIYKGKDINNPPFVNTFFHVLNARMEYTGEERSLSLSDSIYIKFGLVDVEPELAIGDFGKKTYNFTDPIAVDAFKDLGGSISLDDASLDLTFENSFGIEAHIDINKVEGVNSKSASAVSLISPIMDPTIELRRGVNAGQYVQPRSRTLRFDKSNSNFKAFIENLPNRIEPDFAVTTRPNGSNNFTDFAFYDSYLKTKLELRVPMTVGLDNFSLTKKQAFDISEDLEGVKEGKLLLEVANDFPWEAELILEFLDEMDSLVLIGLEAGKSIVNAASVDPQSGRTNAPEVSELVMDLSRDELLKLRTAKKLRIKAVFNTDQAKRFAVYSDYTMDLQLRSQFTYENN